MRKSFKDMAARQITARNSLIKAIKRPEEACFNGCGDNFTARVDDETANKIADLYINKKIAKLSVNIGQFTIKSAVFLDDDVIANAAEMVA